MTRPNEAEVVIGLHTRVVILYVVDGYCAQLVNEDEETLREAYGETPSAALAALSTPPSAEPVARRAELDAEAARMGKGTTFAMRIDNVLQTFFSGASRKTFDDATRVVCAIAYSTTPPAAAQDTARLDWLEAKRAPYSRPPMRAVSGSQWSVIVTHGPNAEPTLRESIDLLIAARAAGGEP